MKTTVSLTLGSLILIEMDWTDSGARVFTNRSDVACPRCSQQVEPNVEHLCGDRARPRLRAIGGNHGR